MLKVMDAKSKSSGCSWDTDAGLPSGDSRGANPFKVAHDLL